MANKYIIPVMGQIYSNRNGGQYRCTGNASYADGIQRDRAVALGEHRASMIRLNDGWLIEVHGLHQCENGTVEWNRSSGGSFQSEHLPRCWQMCKEKGIDMGKYFTYLDGLRDSSVVNMYGASPYLQATFWELRDDYTLSKEILAAWMDSFKSTGGM